MSSRTDAIKILLVGKDARTDAMAAACQRSPSPTELYAFAEMETPGLWAKCEDVFTGSLTDRARRLEVARIVEPDLVLVGPEEPLASGFVDDMEELGIAAFGPTRELAAIEASKSWARGILDRHGIPGNPEYRVFESEEGLGDYMEELGSFVVKPDGLTAGKGVRVFGEHLESIEESVAYAKTALAQGGCVLVEERLEGEEFSLQTITDGRSFLHCPLVQDHKRAHEGDRGPNTGGMGSYSCADFSLPFLRESDVAAAHTISERVVAALAEEVGRPYRGVLYGGFMATAEGIRLIEYNARFGDPEAMNVLPLLRADFVELCSAVTRGELGEVEDAFAAKASVCKYVVPESYPETVASPGKIEVRDEDFAGDDVEWFWAACEREGSEVQMTSSRSGAVVGIGDSLPDAERLAERAADEVGGRVRHRADIGRPEVIESRMRHMKALRGESATVDAQAA
jgi:phosphoribosylamine--glycine ligase